MRYAQLRLDGDRITGWRYPVREKGPDTCDYALIIRIDEAGHEATDYTVIRDRAKAIVDVAYSPQERTVTEKIAEIRADYDPYLLLEDDNLLREYRRRVTEAREA